MHSKLNNKRILIVSNDAWFFVSHRLPIAKAIVNAGATCHVAAHHDATVEQILATGSHFHNWQIAPRGKSIFHELKSMYSLFNIIRSVDPHIIHLVTIKPVLYGGLLARLLRVKSVVFAISGLGYLFQDKSSPKSPLQRLAMLMYRIVTGHSNASIIVQNNSDRAFFTEALNIEEKRVHKLPGSGVNLTQFANTTKENDIPLVVLTARMLHDKGINYFVEAAELIQQQGVKARFALIGYSDPENPRSVPLKQLQQWHDDGTIEYWGHRDDIPQILQSADIYCLPTIYGEGLPKSILEGLACGCAVVTTDWPGCNEVIKHEVNGLLVPPKNTDALCKALISLINDPNKRKMLGIAGRKTVANGYSVETVVDKTLSIYTSLDR